MAPGSAVTFVDHEGEEHNALVVRAWSAAMNIAYVGKEEEEDSDGRIVVRETSVPFFEEGMKGFYIKKPEEPAEAEEEAIKEEEATEEEDDIDGMGPLRKGVKETLE